MEDLSNNSTEAMKTSPEKSLLEIGRERRLNFNKNIEAKKGRLKSWFEKARNYFSSSVEKGKDYAFAAPEAAQMGVNMVDTGINDSYEKYIGLPLDEFAAKKQEQAIKLKDDVKSTAATVGTFIQHTAAEGKLEFDKKVTGAKEGIKNGIGKAIGFGFGALSFAEKKRQQLVGFAHEKINAIKASNLQERIAKQANMTAEALDKATKGMKEITSLQEQLTRLRAEMGPQPQVA